jgi:hypothetical protein
MNPVFRLHKDCEGDGHIALVIPRMPTGERIRLTKEGGPLGTILNWGDGSTLALFDRKKVRKFLERECPELFDK